MKTKIKNEKRSRRHKRVRAKIRGTAECPRLAVFRSNKYIYAQLINDVTGTTIAAARSEGLKGTAMEQAAAVGKMIAEAAKKAGITKAVFDRGGFLYTGRVRAVADTAREAGLTI